MNSLHSKLIIYNSSAGSGKTFTLAKEFIKIALQDPLAYRNILAITFTNKACKEMKERIILFLEALSNDSHPQLKEQIINETNLTEEQIKINSEKVLKAILYDYSLFSVSTIDSFFQRILKQFAAELNLYLNYEILLDTDEAIAWITDQLLIKAEENAELKIWISKFLETKLSDFKSIQSFNNELVSACKLIFREHVIPVESIINSTEQNDIELLLKQSLEVVHTFENEMDLYVNSFLNIIAEHKLTIDDFSHKKSGFAGNILKFSKHNKNYEIGKRLRDVYEKNDGWCTKTSDNSQLINEIVAPRFVLIINKIIEKFDSEITHYNDHIEIIKNIYIFGLFKEIYKLKNDFIKETGQMPLSESTSYINKIVNEAEDAPFLYDKIGTYYNYILIDETQDTSLLQWNNLKALVINSLSEGGLVIVVGDVKQSVYRWRGGDLELLNFKIENEVKPFETIIKNLTTNWRSSKTVIDFNNQLFQRIVKQIDLPILNELYKTSEQTVGKQMKDKGYVELNFIPVTNQKNTKEFESQSIEKTLEILNDLKLRGVNYKDIAIITRTNSEGSEIVEQLVNLDIPFISSESLFINKNKVITFIINVLSFLVKPNLYITRYAILSFLKPEFFNENIEEVRKLIQTYEFYRFLPESFVNQIRKLKHSSVQKVVNNIIYEFSLTAQSPAFLQFFQDLIFDFTHHNPNDIDSFLTYWKNEVLEKNNHSVKLPEGQDAVNIITIHKSKGLEFKYVIIPFADWSVNFNNKNNIEWLPFKLNSIQYLPILMSKKLLETKTFSSYAIEEMKYKIIDGLNVFYVACTRAETELYIITKKSSKVTSLENTNTLSQVLYTVYSKDLENNNIFQYGEKNTISKQTPQKPTYENEFFIEQKSDDVFKIKESRKNVFFNEEMKKGKMLHYIFEQIIYKEDITKILDKMELEGLINLNEKLEIKEILRTLFQNVKQLDDWFSNKYKVLVETSLYDPISDSFYIPDRMMISEEEIIVIDYKLNKPEHYSNYIEQVKNYTQLISKTTAKNVSGYLLFVNNQLLERVV